jgi:ParB family chromosome partitioning protein
LAAKPRLPSPILSAAGRLIDEASGSLVAADSPFSHSFEVDIARVRPDPAQPRRNFDPDALASLAATLQAEGQLQPVLVRPDADGPGRWILVAGERRWRAAQSIGWTRLLAIAHHGDADIASLIENLQRVDLAPLEEARGIERLLREKGWTQEQAARALGRATSDISGTLRILRLPEAVLTAVLTSEPPPAKNVLIELARIEAGPLLERLAALARTGGLTVKAIRQARETHERLTARPADAAAQDSDGGAPDTDLPSETGVLSRAVKAVERLDRRRRGLSDAEAELLSRLRAAIDIALQRHGAA